MYMIYIYRPINKDADKDERPASRSSSLASNEEPELAGLRESRPTTAVHRGTRRMNNMHVTVQIPGRSQVTLTERRRLMMKIMN